MLDSALICMILLNRVFPEVRVICQDTILGNAMIAKQIGLRLEKLSNFCTSNYSIDLLYGVNYSHHTTNRNKNGCQNLVPRKICESLRLGWSEIRKTSSVQRFSGRTYRTKYQWIEQLKFPKKQSSCKIITAACKAFKPSSIHPNPFIHRWSALTVN